MIDLIPVVLVAFKVLVLGTGMFFAIKWHYDQGRKGKIEERRAVLRAGGKVTATVVVSLAGLGLISWGLIALLGIR